MRFCRPGPGHRTGSRRLVQLRPTAPNVRLRRHAPATLRTLRPIQAETVEQQKHKRSDPEKEKPGTRPLFAVLSPLLMDSTMRPIRRTTSPSSLSGCGVGLNLRPLGHEEHGLPNGCCRTCPAHFFQIAIELCVPARGAQRHRLIPMFAPLQLSKGTRFTNPGKS